VKKINNEIVSCVQLAILNLMNGTKERMLLAQRKLTVGQPQNIPNLIWIHSKHGTQYATFNNLFSFVIKFTRVPNIIVMIILYSSAVE